MRPAFNLDHTPDPSRSDRPRRARAALAVLFGVLAAPVVYEVAAISAARWASLNGPITTAETPVLDAIARSGRECWRFGEHIVHDRLHDLPWHSSVLLAVGAAWVVVGYKILHRP